MFVTFHSAWLNSSKIFTCLLVITLFAAFGQSELFIFPWLAGYYLFIIFSVLFIGAGTIGLFRKEITSPIDLPVTVVFFMLLGLYTLLHGYFMGMGLNLRHNFMVNACSVFTMLFFLLNLKLIRLRFVFRSIMALAIFESVFCMMQFFELIKVKNSYFHVTGSWDNPNVTAMFLAMAIPAFIPDLLQYKGRFRRVLSLLLIFILTALVMLKCRTAYLGLITMTTVVINQRYNLLNQLKDKRNTNTSILVVTALFFLLTALGTYLYHTKKNSADGRKFIWKLSLKMVAEEPLTGYGYGSFERNYNRYQAEYIRNGWATPQEIAKAGFVNMGYNEFLENAVEGGVIGLMIIFGLFLSLLMIPVMLSKSEIIEPVFLAAYAGVAGFIVMSMFNFTLRSIPLMLVLIIYAAICCDVLVKKERMKNWLSITISKVAFFKRGTAMVLLLVAAGVLISQYLTPIANYKNRKALELAKQKQFKEATQLLVQIKDEIPDHSSFLKNYGAVLLKTGDCSAAITYFNQAKMYTSDPELYMLSGRCYRQIGRFDQAAKEYEMASLLEPTRFLPKVTLMNLYANCNDTLQTAKIAHEILQLDPKIPSPKVLVYKQAASAILTKFNKL